MRMARVNITIPDQLLKHAKAAGLNVSQLAAAALSAELNRRSKMAGLKAYLAELDAELGPISAEEAAEGEEWAERLFGPPRADVDTARRSA
jgi:post-segregation antitoxin (ccd killing protein)